MGQMDVYLDQHDLYDDDERLETFCRNCGSTDVYWAQVKDQWVLYGTNSRRHVCNAKHLAELRRDAFDSLD